MDIFHVKDSLKSYTYPIVKLLICILLIVLFIRRGEIIHIDGKIIKVIIGIFCTIVAIGCIYCGYISVFEIFQVHENRSTASTNLDSTINESSAYTIDEIVTMAESNDIIEIKIIANNRIIVVGASSDCKAGNSNFFDKLYYIDNREFKNIKDFKYSLRSYSNNEKLTVTMIDGVMTGYGGSS